MIASVSHNTLTPDADVVHASCLWHQREHGWRVLRCLHAGATTTRFLESLPFTPKAIEVVAPGMNTTVQVHSLAPLSTQVLSSQTQITPVNTTQLSTPHFSFHHILLSACFIMKQKSVEAPTSAWLSARGLFCWTASQHVHTKFDQGAMSQMWVLGTQQ